MRCRNCRAPPTTRPPNTPARRALRDDAERAAFGVAAEQRALRALEHLDPLDVEQRGVEAVLAYRDRRRRYRRRRPAIARGLVLRRSGTMPRMPMVSADCRASNVATRRRRHRAVGEIDQALDVAISLSACALSTADRDRRAPGDWSRGLSRGDDDVADLAGVPTSVGGGGLLRRRGRGGGRGRVRRNVGGRQHLRLDGGIGSGLRASLSGEHERQDGDRGRRGELHGNSPCLPTSRGNAERGSRGGVGRFGDSDLTV